MGSRDEAYSGPGMMLLSALLFAYFGFFHGVVWSTPSATTGQPVAHWVLLGWTLRGSAVGFAASAGLTFASPRAGNVVYALVGLLGAALFVIVLVLGHLDKQHAAVMSPVLLLIFAVWNGYGSFSSLRAMRGVRSARSAPWSRAGDVDR